MSDKPVLDVQFFPAPKGFEDCFSMVYRLNVDLPPDQTVSDLLQLEWGNLRFIDFSETTYAQLGDVRLDSRGFLANGPTSAPIRFTLGKARLWGFGLLPLGWSMLVRASAKELANTVVKANGHDAFAHFEPLADALSDSDGDDLREYRLICDHIARLARPPRDEARVRAVQSAMVDPYLVQIPEFAERSGISVRTLERVCLKSCGFSPNVVLRRQRLVRSLASFMLDGDARWSEAIDKHYHDQPHFVREFHHFMGMSPSDYADQDHPILEAFIENRQKVWGKPVRAKDAQQAV